MSTTAVFAEILVVGFQASAWLTLLVLGFFGTDWITLTDLEKWVALITIVVVATAYMLGVIMDRIADDLYVWGRRLKREQAGSVRWPGWFRRRRYLAAQAPGRHRVQRGCGKVSRLSANKASHSPSYDGKWDPQRPCRSCLSKHPGRCERGTSRVPSRWCRHADRGRDIHSGGDRSCMG